MSKSDFFTFHLYFAKPLKPCVLFWRQVIVLYKPKWTIIQYFYGKNFEEVTFWWDDGNLHFVLDLLIVYGASPLKQVYR